MTTDLQDAIAAFRDLMETRARLRQEINEYEARIEVLTQECGATEGAYHAAKLALLVAASGGLYKPGGA